MRLGTRRFAAEHHLPILHLYAGIQFVESLHPVQLPRSASERPCDGYALDRMFWLRHVVFAQCIYAIPWAAQAGLVVPSSPCQ